MGLGLGLGLGWVGWGWGWGWVGVRLGFGFGRGRRPEVFFLRLVKERERTTAPAEDAAPAAAPVTRRPTPCAPEGS